ncbi:hypothetical protein BDV93DRAFT_564845 [Ceratobasidium sp. AG-I]|nr:hypothetical protein BDV93DRAFT_564845 [Ceratobasidium sp. AG-I]
MSSLPPRPPPTESAAKQVNRLAKRDPQLYPLAAVVLVTVGVGAYFLTSKPTGADQGERAPSMPSRVKDEVEKHKAANDGKR